MVMTAQPTRCASSGWVRASALRLRRTQEPKKEEPSIASPWPAQTSCLEPLASKAVVLAASPVAQALPRRQQTRRGMTCIGRVWLIVSQIPGQWKEDRDGNALSNL